MSAINNAEFFCPSLAGLCSAAISAKVPIAMNITRCIMHIGQGFISLNGAIKMAVPSNVVQPKNMSKKISLDLTGIMMTSKVLISAF